MRISSIIQELKGKLVKSFWIKSGIITTSTNLSQTLLNFFSFFFLVRVLDVSSYGTWIIYLSIINVFELSRNSFITHGVVKYYIDTEESEKPKFLYNAFLLNILASIILPLILLSCLTWINQLYHIEELILLLKFGIIQLLITSILNFINSICQANYNFSTLFISGLVRQSIYFLSLCLIFILNVEIDLLQLVYIQIFAALVCTMVAYFLASKSITYEYVFDFRSIKKLINYGVFTFSSGITAIISGNIDQLMTGSLLSAASTGILNVGLRILQIVEVPTQSMSTILFPKSAETFNQGGQKSTAQLYEKSVAIILTFLVPTLIVLFILSKQIIHIVVGLKFIDSVPLLRIIIVYSIMIPFGRQAAVILNSIGKTKQSFYLVLIAVSSKIVLNFIFIEKFGVIGVPIGTAISTFLGFAASQLYLRNFLNVRVLNIFKFMKNYYYDGFMWVKKRYFYTRHV